MQPHGQVGNRVTIDAGLRMFGGMNSHANNFDGASDIFFHPDRDVDFLG